MTGWSPAGTAGGGRRLTAAALVAALIVPGLAVAAVRAVTRRPALVVRAVPAKATVTAGASARFVLSVAQRGRPRAVRLRIRSRLPPGVRARLSPKLVRKRRGRAVLTLLTAASTPPGTYRLRVASATLTLKVAVAAAEPSQNAIVIVGDAPRPLAPGTSEPLDVSLHNPYSFALVVRSVTVEVRSVAAPRASGTLACGPGDFATAPLNAPGGVLLGAGATSRLSALGVPQAQWPRLAMLDRPADQDGCQGATLRLVYSGSGVKAAG